MFIFFQLPPVHQPKPVITPRWIIPTTAVRFVEFITYNMVGLDTFMFIVLELLM